MTVQSTRRAIFIVFETVATITFVVMLASSLLQVFFRYVLNAPLMWTEELARLMCVFTTYFGSVAVLIAREHIRVDMLDSMLGERGLRYLSMLIDLLLVWFMISFVIGCWLMMKASWNTYAASMGWFRTAYLYIGVGIAAVAMTLVTLLDLYSKVRVAIDARAGSAA